MCDIEPTVYVVDDDVSVRESLRLLIESAGWEAETFASGEEFLARKPLPAPCCLVLDLQLPELNGLDVQKFVADRDDMPIIFITGHSDVPAIVRAMKAAKCDAHRVERVPMPVDQSIPSSNRLATTLAV